MAMGGCGGCTMSEPSLDFTSQPQGRSPMPSACKSAPVNTATTPSVAAAAVVSMRLIFARAWGERANTA